MYENKIKSFKNFRGGVNSNEINTLRKVFLHICEEFEYIWIGKDNGMIPIYMHEICGYESKILTVDLKHDLPNFERGIYFIKVKRIFGFLGNFAYWVKLLKRYNIFKYLIKNAEKIDVLMLFHVSRCSYWYSYIYKKLNPNGKIYIKADFNLGVYQKELSVVNSSPKNLKEFFRKRRETKEYNKRKKLIPLVDLISYESLEAYDFMKNEYAGMDTKGKTIYLPNGYDNLFVEKNFKIKEFKEKENIILTVGRLGTKEKNTELLLESLKEIDLKKWKVILIGYETEELLKYKEKYFRENPELKEKIIFTGEIKDRKELYEYYNKSKVFVLPSKWESFGIVMVEAMAFGNYVITSNTCAANDITNYNNIGKIIKIDSKIELENSLKEAINGKVNLEEKHIKTLEYVKNFKNEELIKKLMLKLK